MQHGAALVCTTTLSIGETTLRCGHRQAAQFWKAFRRYHGVSPTAFRRI